MRLNSADQIFAVLAGIRSLLGREPWRMQNHSYRTCNMPWGGTYWNRIMLVKPGMVMKQWSSPLPSEKVIIAHDKSRSAGPFMSTSWICSGWAGRETLVKPFGSSGLTAHVFRREMLRAVDAWSEWLRWSKYRLVSLADFTGFWWFKFWIL